MPVGGPPPILALSQGVFNALHAMTYNSSTQAFTSGGASYYLCAEQVSGTTDRVQWFYATAAEAGTCPKGLIPQITGDVITRGSYNTGNGTVTYNGSNYRVRLVVGTGPSPVLLAEAVVV